jgi:tRNA threonylcarbamoyladenosine biosynthesis protein TsaB
MRVLGFDTSSLVTALAVVDADRVLAHDDRSGEQRHAEVLLPRIAAALVQAQLTLSEIELIAVGIGPGSFTGLRVGLATAKGLALATGIPLCGVSSLRVLARGVAARAEIVLAALDAGKGEVFGALYLAGESGPSPLLAPLRAEPDAFARAVLACGVALPNVSCCGGGVRRYQETFERVFGARVRLADVSCDMPSGVHVAAEGRAVLRAEGPADVAVLEPVYLRGSDAKLPDEPLAL